MCDELGDEQTLETFVLEAGGTVRCRHVACCSASARHVACRMQRLALHALPAPCGVAWGGVAWRRVAVPVLDRWLRRMLREGAEPRPSTSRRAAPLALHRSLATARVRARSRGTRAPKRIRIPRSRADVAPAVGTGGMPEWQRGPGFPARVCRGGPPSSVCRPRRGSLFVCLFVCLVVWLVCLFVGLFVC